MNLDEIRHEDNIYLSIDGVSYPMLKTEYDSYLEEGLKNPVLIGEKIYMVNDKDYKVLIKMERKIKKLKLS